MERVSAVVLAAGKGTRMKSKKNKVLHRLCSRPMLLYVIDTLSKLEPEEIIVVTGHQAEDVESVLNSTGLTFARQEPQLGTAHAIMCAVPKLKSDPGVVTVLSGDVPLVRVEILRRLIEAHKQNGALMTVLTAELDDPGGYGRIVRDGSGTITRIIEDKDASVEEKKIKEVNAGIYCFDADFLRKELKEISADNAQGEYYITDLAEKAGRCGGLTAVSTDEPERCLGINDRIDMAKAERIIRMDILKKHMKEGVTIIDPDTTYIGADVKIGRDTIIYPGCFIDGRTVIGEDCTIRPGCWIENCKIGNSVLIKNFCVMAESTIEDRVSVGPFAHIRPETYLERDVRIGNFVEVKKSRVGRGTKANHLTYLGDSKIGAEVNIGCGTITCNYDGKKKHITAIEDGVFVGSDVQFVAPVTIGKNSIIGAGSVITKSVPPNSLAIARGRQVTLEGRGRSKRKDDRCAE